MSIRNFTEAVVQVVLLANRQGYRLNEVKPVIEAIMRKCVTGVTPHIGTDELRALVAATAPDMTVRYDDVYARLVAANVLTPLDGLTGRRKILRLSTFAWDLAKAVQNRRVSGPRRVGSPVSPPN